MLCPLCREKVSGGGVEEMSQELTGHLREAHRMTDLPDPEEGRVVRPSYDAHDRNSVGARWALPGEGAAIVPDRQQVTDFAVRCPFCLATVTGRSENELGEGMREHWSRDHGILPRLRLTAALERGGGRRQ